jgi:hypothetical protein
MIDRRKEHGLASSRSGGTEKAASLRREAVGDSAGGDGHQTQVPGLRACADASPEPGGKEHSENLDGGGKGEMKGTRIVAIVIIALLVISLLASLLTPFLW